VSLLRAFIEHGGSVLVLAECNAQVHMYNALTQHFGITLYQDCVLRTVFYKYNHPKECYIKNAMICPMLLEKNLNNTSSSSNDENLNLLYPYGCSLDVFKPAMPLIGSGSTSYPAGRPVGAFYYSQLSKGKLIVFGSGHAFTDK
jgi:intraflagellar transport protein 52